MEPLGGRELRPDGRQLGRSPHNHVESWDLVAIVEVAVLYGRHKEGNEVAMGEVDGLVATNLLAIDKRPVRAQVAQLQSGRLVDEREGALRA
eukprot:scaffold20628_cov31-Tisochrysis_lutea.AAC.1